MRASRGGPASAFVEEGEEEEEESAGRSFSIRFSAVAESVRMTTLGMLFPGGFFPSQPLSLLPAPMAPPAPELEVGGGGAVGAGDLWW